MNAYMAGYMDKEAGVPPEASPYLRGYMDKEAAWPAAILPALKKVWGAATWLGLPAWMGYNYLGSRDEAKQNAAWYAGEDRDKRMRNWAAVGLLGGAGLGYMTANEDKGDDPMHRAFIGGLGGAVAGGGGALAYDTYG